MPSACFAAERESKIGPCISRSPWALMEAVATTCSGSGRVVSVGGSVVSVGASVVTGVGTEGWVGSGPERSPGSSFHAAKASARISIRTSRTQRIFPFPRFLGASNFPRMDMLLFCL